MLADEDRLLGLREHAELAGAAELEGKLADDLISEAVECGDDRIVEPHRRVEIDARLHRGRCLLGERDRKDLVRLRALRSDEVDDPGGEDVRLSGPGAGDDEQGPFAVLDGSPLLVGQRPQDVGRLLPQ